MTREQWPSVLADHWPNDVALLAEAMANEHDCGFALHDALLESGHDALAEHFADHGVHWGRGRWQCWVLALIRGTGKRRHLLLVSDTACFWLGITPYQFRRLMERLEIVPEDSYRNSWSQSCPLWAPEDMLAIPQAEIIAIKTRRRRRLIIAERG